MENNISLNVTPEEYKFLLEALLFSSSVDACANWDLTDVLKMVDMAKNLRVQNPTIPTSNIIIFKDNDGKFEFNDEHSEDLLKYFPETKQEEE